jgi:hypothetical protein
MAETIEGVGYTVADYEDDYVVLDGQSAGVCRLLGRAGVEPIGDGAAETFARHEDDQFWGKYVREYRAATGREFPPLYRIRITVEAEPSRAAPRRPRPAPGRRPWVRSARSTSR